MTAPGPSGPVFVVGSMRSGSTLLRLMLDSHPRIAIPPETGFMGGAAAVKQIPGWRPGAGWYERLGWSEAEVDERLRDFFGGMFERYAAEQGKARWGEKTPFHTAHMAGLAQIFPDAALVGIVRHPGAVATSLRRRFHYSFPEAVDYWSDTAKQLVSAGTALGDRFVLCRYEDLVTHSEEVLRALLTFLGEDWAAEVTQHHEVHRERGTPRAAEGSTVTTDPVDARRAEAWASDLGAEERARLGDVAPLAGLLGYDVASPDAEVGWGRDGSPTGWTVTGTGLAARRGGRAPVGLEPSATPLPVDVPPEELAARLAAAEAALARARSRRAVRVTDALRRLQHGRSRSDAVAAWRAVRDAVRSGR